MWGPSHVHSRQHSPRKRKSTPNNTAKAPPPPALLIPPQCRPASIPPYTPALASLPHRRQAVDLVKEDDGRLVPLGLLEKQAQLALRLPHPLGQHVGPLAHEEGHAAPRAAAGVRGQRARHERLARACSVAAAAAGRGRRARVRSTCPTWAGLGCGASTQRVGSGRRGVSWRLGARLMCRESVRGLIAKKRVGHRCSLAEPGGPRGYQTCQT
jgi:hypothetical protein